MILGTALSYWVLMSLQMVLDSSCDTEAKTQQKHVDLASCPPRRHLVSVQRERQVMVSSLPGSR